MTAEHTMTVPFEDWGPNDRYWLDSFRPESELRRFLSIGRLDEVPVPQERVTEWENPPERRERLAEAFRKTSLPYSPRQLASIEALRDSRAMVVATGQQPGALGGPLYTFAKILSAIVFSERLSERWKLPVIPVLWDGGDDHDLEEIGRLDWLGGQEGNSRLTYDLSAFAGRPAWSVPFTQEMFQASVEFVERNHPATEFRAATLQFLSGLWREGLTWSDFFDRFWLKVFEATPLLVARPWEEGFRSLAAPVLRREIESPLAHLEDLSRSSIGLETAGYPPRIHKREGACSFFYVGAGQRRRVQIEGGGAAFSVEGMGEASKDAVISASIADPCIFSPNALLRPLVQDAILPTAAVVLGPSEIAYHSQLGEMYSRHKIPRPWVIPRFSLTLMGSNQRSRLEEFGLAISDLRRDTNDLAKSLISSEDLDTSLSVLDDLLERTGKGREQILERARKRRSGLEKGIQTQFGKVESTLHQIEDLLRREEMKRSSDKLDRIRSLKESMLPAGDLQERTVGLVPFLCRFGFEWLKDIRDAARSWTGAEHIFYTP